MARTGGAAVAPAKGGLVERIQPMAQGLLVGGVAILATPSAVLIVVLLLPTVMAAMADRAPGRPVARAVALFGLAGACPALDLLWRSGHSLAVALTLATDLRSLAVCWAAQAAGWLLTQILPFLMTLALEAQTNAEQARLRRRRADMEAEWPGAADRVR